MLAPIFYFFSSTELNINLKLADTLLYFAFLYAGAIWLFSILNRFFPTGQNIFLLLIWVSIIMFAIQFLHITILNMLPKLNANYGMFETSSKLKWVFGSMFLGITAMYAFLKKKNATERNLNNQLLELNRLQHETELQMVQKQLQPHFLFNSLNSINALIAIDPDKASDMVIQLSEFFRNSLKSNTQQIVKLTEEITHIRLYLNIEKIRFEDRLNIVFEVNKEAENATLPSLILQPLLENAIKFGLYGTLEKVEVMVSAKIANTNLEIQIKNNFDSELANTKKGTGYGIAGTQKRLQLIYGQHDCLNTAIENNQFICTLTIPQHPIA